MICHFCRKENSSLTNSTNICRCNQENIKGKPMKLTLDKSSHNFEPGDLFKQESGFIGMFIYSPDQDHMTPYMIIDLHGNVQARSTSLKLCINQLTSEKRLEFIGRLKIENY